MFVNAGEEAEDETQFIALIENWKKVLGSFREWVWSQIAPQTCLTFDNIFNLLKYIKWEYLKGTLWWWS